MNMRALLLIILLGLTSIVSGQIPDSLKYSSLRPAGFQVALQSDSNALLVDVREFFEYRKSRIKNAVNIPSSGNIQLAADSIDKDLHLFVYCTSGFRSKRVALKFYDYGFRNLYNLDGGISAWRKEGIVVDHKRVPRRR